MPSPESLRRLANLTKKVRDDLRNGGMGVNFKYLFRSTAILARVVEILADHVATEAEERRKAELEGALDEAVDQIATELEGGESAEGGESPEGGETQPRYGRSRAEETA